MPRYSTDSDEELFLQLQKGATDCFAEIYERYWDKLFNAAFRRLQNTAVCEEIVQDVFTKFWANRFSITISSGLSNYLYTSVKYNIIDYYRKQVLQAKYVAHFNRLDHEDNSSEENIFLKELRAQIHAVITSLPEKCRTVYQLSRIEHKNNKEIALLLNISEKTVEGHLTKALNRIKLNIGTYLIVGLIFFLNKYK